MPRPRAKRQRKASPLGYMLRVMNDPTASNARRDRMAVTAARYLHAKVDGVGKKAAKAEAARTAGDGTGWGDLLGKH